MNRVVGSLVVWLILTWTLSAWADSWPLGSQTKIELASKDEGREILAKSDAFLSRLSPFDRAVRLKSAEPVSQEAFVAHIVEQVLPWHDEDRAKLAGVIEGVEAKLAPLNLPFPERIALVKTTGEEEAGAAYCRGAAIVLPVGMLAQKPERLEPLILHELFHVLSNQNHALRQQLYAILGFAPCNEVALPETLQARKLTNPDAPESSYFVELKHASGPVRVVPVLFANAEKYDPQRGKLLFDYLAFRLMAVEGEAAALRPVLKEGKPRMFTIDDLPDYYEKIGLNTDYIIHPEEVLADNFVILLQGKKNVKTPRIQEQLAQALAAAKRSEADEPAKRSDADEPAKRSEADSDARPSESDSAENSDGDEAKDDRTGAKPGE